MRSSRAERWTTRIYHWKEQPGNVNSVHFFGWEDFCEEFKSHFTPAHADVDARICLESENYYQRDRPLDDYLNDFHDLVADSGYTDPCIVVLKFHRGLDPSVGYQARDPYPYP
jgi:hypothetical protein